MQKKDKKEAKIEIQQNVPRDVPPEFRYYYYRDTFEEEVKKVVLFPAALWRAEGKVYYRNGKYNLAAECYSRALEQEPTNAKVLIGRSQCYYHLTKYDLAMKDAQKARQLNPDDPHALYQKAKLYFVTGHFEYAYLTFLHGTKVHTFPYTIAFTLGTNKCRTAIFNCIGADSCLEIRNEDVVEVEKTIKNSKRHEPLATDYSSGSSFLPKPNPLIQQNMKHPELSKNIKDDLSIAKLQRETRIVLGKDAPHKELLEIIKSSLENDIKKYPHTSVDTKTDELLELFRKHLEYLDERQRYWQRYKPIYSRGVHREKETKKSDVNQV